MRLRRFDVPRRRRSAAEPHTCGDRPPLVASSQCTDSPSTWVSRATTTSAGSCANTPHGRAARLFAGEAVDETAAAGEWRPIEASGGLELGPLGGQQDLVDQRRTTVAGGWLDRPPSLRTLATAGLPGLPSP